MSKNQDDRRLDDPIPDAQRELIVTERPEGVAPGGPTDRKTGAGTHPGNRPTGGSISVMTLITASALALIFGLIGAWAYDAFLSSPSSTAEDPQGDQAIARAGESVGDPDATEPSDSRNSPDPSGAVRAESARIDRLADQVDRLRATVESSQSAPDPRVDALGDRLAELENRIAAVEPTSEVLEGLARQSRNQSEQIDAMADTIDRLESDLTSVKDRVDAAGGIGGGLLGSGSGRNALDSPLAAGIGAGSEAEAPPDPGQSEGLVRELVTPDPDDADGAADSALEQGIDQFEADEFEEARQTFFELIEQEPGDARIWYYAALANGKATGEWKGETERLVLQGVDRERAGTPPKTAIDATFAGLTERQGSAWLDYYRRRADE
ncbi:hypothetical protein AB1L88_14070 [Tautonia sp. JC769]|uniref:hypothetical protein n=1 Tax=Tautonia sp. JC769 TaxID=3232135 RepID=UPI0034588D07